MKTIRLHSIFPEMISSRESLKVIFPLLKDDSTFTLDFEQIRFISRSVADELFTVQMEKHIRFEYTNTNPNIDAMIKAVSNTQNGSKRNNSDIPYTSFATEEELYKFLEAI
jgi:hypothetical protein